MRRLLVPLDGSDRGDQVLSFLDGVLPELRAHQLILVRVVSPGDALDAASDRLEAAARRARASGISTATLAVLGDDPAAEVLKVADLVQASLLALSTHGAGQSEQKHGSVAARVIAESLVPVLLVGRQALPIDPGSGLRRVLVAMDASRGADAALPIVAQLTRPGEVEVLLLTVDEPGTPVDLELARGRLLRHGVERVRTIHAKGPVVDALLDAARRESVDLLALGARGQTGGAGLGSVARDVAQRCDIPLLLAR